MHWIMLAMQYLELEFQKFPLAAFKPFFSVDMAVRGFQARMGDCPRAAVRGGFSRVEGWNGRRCAAS